MYIGEILFFGLLDDSQKILRKNSELLDLDDLFRFLGVRLSLYLSLRFLKMCYVIFTWYIERGLMSRYLLFKDISIALWLNQESYNNYPITSLGLDPSAGPTIPILSRVSTTRAARPYPSFI